MVKVSVGLLSLGVFYGNQGKRDCVKRFFTSLLAQKKPFQLYFASDEDMSWLYEKPAFTKEWTGLLINLIKSGSQPLSMLMCKVFAQL